jgi:hypothetical protein
VAEKKIYWICGHLRPEERNEDFLKYGLKLNNLFRREAQGNSALREFKFVNVYSCTKREFARIWSDPSTYGIFWNSHGDQYGRPQADPNLDAPTLAEERRSMDLDPRSKTYVVRGNSKQDLRQQVTHLAALAKGLGLPYLAKGYDEGRVVRLEDGRYEIEVVAAALPAASPNLKFIAFMSCWAGQQEAAWKKLMPAGARIPSFPEKNSTAPGAHRGWIDDWIDRLKVPEDLFRRLAPTGARSQLSGTGPGDFASAVERLLTPSAYAATQRGRVTRTPTARGFVLTGPPPGYRPPRPTGVNPAQGKGGIMGGGAGWSPADIRSRFRPTPPRRPIIGGTYGAGGPNPGRRFAGGSGLAGSSLTADIHSRFRTDRWWETGDRTGGQLGRRGGGGGFGIGDGGIVAGIHSRFRPTPTHQPLRPPGPIRGEVTFGPVTITYSPRRKVVVPGGW